MSSDGIKKKGLTCPKKNWRCPPQYLWGLAVKKWIYSYSYFSLTLRKIFASHKNVKTNESYSKPPLVFPIKVLTLVQKTFRKFVPPLIRRLIFLRASCAIVIITIIHGKWTIHGCVGGPTLPIQNTWCFWGIVLKFVAFLLTIPKLLMCRLYGVLLRLVSLNTFVLPKVFFCFSAICFFIARWKMCMFWSYPKKWLFFCVPYPAVAVECEDFFRFKVRCLFEDSFRAHVYAGLLRSTSVLNFLVYLSDPCAFTSGE